MQTPVVHTAAHNTLARLHTARSHAAGSVGAAKTPLGRPPGTHARAMRVCSWHDEVLASDGPIFQPQRKPVVRSALGTNSDGATVRS